MTEGREEEKKLPRRVEVRFAAAQPGGAVLLSGPNVGLMDVRRAHMAAQHTTWRRLIEKKVSRGEIVYRLRHGKRKEKRGGGAATIPATELANLFKHLFGLRCVGLRCVAQQSAQVLARRSFFPHRGTNRFSNETSLCTAAS